MKTYKQLMNEGSHGAFSKIASWLNRRDDMKAEVVDSGGQIPVIHVYNNYGHYVFGTGSGVWGYDFYTQDPYDPKAGDPKAGKDIGIQADASTKEVVTAIVKTLNAHRGIKEDADKKPAIQMFRLGNKYEICVGGELHSTHSSLEDAKRAVKNLKWNEKNQTKEPFFNAVKKVG